MGKRRPPPGLPKEGTKKQLREIETRALLLGGTYDKATSMIVKNEFHDNGPNRIPSYWTTYYDQNGVELTLGEAKRRLKEADKRRYKYSRHRRKNYKSSFVGDSISAGVWDTKLYNSHMEDALQYAMAPRSHGKSAFINNMLPREVTEEKDEKSGVRPVGSDTIRIARRPDVRTWK